MDFGFITLFFIMISSRRRRNAAQVFASVFLSALSITWLIPVTWLWIEVAIYSPRFGSMLDLSSFGVLGVLGVLGVFTKP